MNFSEALDYIKGRNRLTRKGWNGVDMYVELQTPDEHSKMRRPYIFMKPVDGDLVPWVASQSDILADDWEIA